MLSRARSAYRNNKNFPVANGMRHAERAYQTRKRKPTSSCSPELEFRHSCLLAPPQETYTQGYRSIKRKVVLNRNATNSDALKKAHQTYSQPVPAICAVAVSASRKPAFAIALLQSSVGVPDQAGTGLSPKQVPGQPREERLKRIIESRAYLLRL